jgi:hypothetical protein
MMDKIYKKEITGELIQGFSCKYRQTTTKFYIFGICLYKIKEYVKV